MLINNPTVPTKSELQTLLESGWLIQSDGPSGIQLIQPKTPSVATIALLVIGSGLLLFIYRPYGLFLIGLAMVDFFLFRKHKSKFLPKASNPSE